MGGGGAQCPRAPRLLRLWLPQTHRHVKPSHKAAFSRNEVRRNCGCYGWTWQWRGLHVCGSYGIIRGDDWKVATCIIIPKQPCWSSHCLIPSPSVALLGFFPRRGHGGPWVFVGGTNILSWQAPPPKKKKKKKKKSSPKKVPHFPAEQADKKRKKKKKRSSLLSRVGGGGGRNNHLQRHKNSQISIFWRIF